MFSKDDSKSELNMSLNYIYNELMKTIITTAPKFFSVGTFQCPLGLCCIFPQEYFMLIQSVAVFYSSIKIESIQIQIGSPRMNGWCIFIHNIPIKFSLDSLIEMMLLQFKLYGSYTISFSHISCTGKILAISIRLTLWMWENQKYMDSDVVSYIRSIW